MEKKYSLKLILYIFFLNSSFSYAQHPIFKLLGGFDSEHFDWQEKNVKVIQTMDNGLLISGSSKSSFSGDITSHNKGNNDYLLFKLNNNGTLEWDKLIGGYDDELLYSVVQTPDGGYIVAGTSNSSSSGDINQLNHGLNDYSVIKIDSLGNTIWSKLYGGSENDFLRSMIISSDGNLVICGASSSNDGDISDKRNENQDIWILKINQSGDILWSKTIGGDATDSANSIAETKDGGFILVGASDSQLSGDFNSVGNGTYDWAVAKIDRIGNVEWAKLFGNDGRDIAYDVLQTNDGQYAIVGNTQAIPEIGDYSGRIIKLDKLGNKIWDKSFSSNDGSFFTEISLTQENEIIASGHSRASIIDNIDTENHGNLDIWVVKFNSLNEIIWNKQFGGAEDDMVFSAINYGKYLIIAGSTFSSSDGDIKGNNNGLSDYFLLTINSNGGIEDSSSTQKIDLSMTSFSQNRIIQKETEGTILFTLKNEGNSKATNVKVLLKIPYSPPFVIRNSQNCTKGTFDSNMWIIPELEAGDSCTLTLIYLPIQSGVWYIESEVFSVDQEDIDSKGNNGIETEDDFARNCLSIPIKMTTDQFGVQLIIEDNKLDILQWYKDGIPISGATSNTLQVKSLGVYEYNTKNFKCPKPSCCPFILERANESSNCCTPLEYLLKK